MSVLKVVQLYHLEDEYKKETGLNKEDIESFREWLKKQPHLPEEYITDLDLVLAYNCCDRSLEMAKKLLDLNLTLRTMFTNLFSDRVYDENTEKTLKTVLIRPLSARSRDGYATIYMNFLDKNPKNFVVLHIIRTCLMLVDLWQNEDGTWPGFMLIIDMSNITIGHLSTFEYTNLQHFFYFLKEAIWLKMKGMHIVNAPPFMDKIVTLLNTVTKIQDFFYIHTDGYQGVDKHYPLEHLPKDVGGSYMTFEECSNDTIAKLKAGAEYFQLEGKKRVCESRRPGTPKTVTDFFGSVEGSFRKLDID